MAGVPSPTFGIQWSLLLQGDVETLFADRLWPPPFLGLGQPGAHFGAARLPESNCEWQKVAMDLMIRAKDVILIPSNNPGTWWEMKYLTNSGLLDKCLFYVPPVAKKWAREEWQQTCVGLRQLGLHPPKSLIRPDSKSDGWLLKFSGDASVCAWIELGLGMTSTGAWVGPKAVPLTREVFRRLCELRLHRGLVNDSGRREGVSNDMLEVNSLEMRLSRSENGEGPGR